MKCPYCQKELPEETKFCSFCGKEIKDDKKICPQCHHEEELEAFYCSECGYNFIDDQKDNKEEIIEDDQELSRVKRKKEHNNKDRKKLYIIIAVVIAFVLVCGTCYFVFFKEDEKVTETAKKKEETTEKLSLEKKKFEIEEGSQDYIEANMDCSYKVKDETIVEVDTFGTITAKKAGETTITVKGENGETIKCTVTVTEAPHDIVIDNYQASSTLQASGYDYSVSNLYDNQLTTCWCEGVDGDGIGETLTVTFQESVDIDTINIINGLSKTESLYYKNGRLKKITLTFDDGSVEEITVNDTYKDQQILSFNSHQTKTVTVRIDEIYQGTTYQDTCITELTFSRQ